MFIHQVQKTSTSDRFYSRNKRFSAPFLTMLFYPSVFSPILNLINDIKDPVYGIEDPEANREDDPGVGVYHVHVSDLRH